MKRTLLGLTLCCALGVMLAAFWLVHEIDQAAMRGPDGLRKEGGL